MKYRARFRQKQIFYIVAEVEADSPEEAEQKIRDGEFDKWDETFDGVDEEEEYRIEEKWE